MTLWDLFPLLVAAWAGFVFCRLLHLAPELVQTRSWSEFFSRLCGTLFSPISFVWESCITVLLIKDPTEDP